jgi:hypothetical protein
MKKFHVIAIFALTTTAAFCLSVEAPRAEDGYVRKVPLDALTVPVPVPVIPPGSSLDLRPGRAPDAGEHMSGYTPLNRESTTPSIGLSIKSPVDDRK